MLRKGGRLCRTSHCVLFLQAAVVQHLVMPNSGMCTHTSVRTIDLEGTINSASSLWYIPSCSQVC
jgi:hypothetical protein